MFRRVQDFLETWGHERDSTLKILAALTDASLAQAVTTDHRTLGRLAWHVATTPAEMMERAGLKVGGPSHESPPPKTAAAIVATYDGAARAVADGVARWTDSGLEVEDDMYGQKWARGMTLLALVVHQAHHRGQMTVLMRQAGLSVPGVYGPSRDEWAKMGMQPPAI
jgi:uncharacterized damage-inducible protein DinB